MRQWLSSWWWNHFGARVVGGKRIFKDSAINDGTHFMFDDGRDESSIKSTRDKWSVA